MPLLTSNTPPLPSPPLPLSFQWTQLRNRKLSMQKLFTKMQAFQYEKIKNNPDTVLSDEVRVLQDEDVQR